MSTSIDAIQLVMKSILSTKPWLRDPIVTPFPWRQEIVADILSRANEDGSGNDQLPLKFGIFWTDNVVSPHPPISRGLRLMVDSIQKAGHKVWIPVQIWLLNDNSNNQSTTQVVEWKPPSHTTPTRIHVSELEDV
jgi:amidase